MLTLYTNIDLKLRNKLHGPMHYIIGVTCVYNGHVFYNLLKFCKFFSVRLLSIVIT